MQGLGFEGATIWTSHVPGGGGGGCGFDGLPPPVARTQLPIPLNLKAATLNPNNPQPKPEALNPKP